MRKSLIAFILICICIFLFQSFLQAKDKRGLKIKDKQGREVGLYKESHALVIGVSDYTAGWPVLPGVKKDVHAVKSILEKNGFSVTLVMNPNREQLFQAFYTFINNYGLKSDNRLLFYFAGHGHTVRQAYGEEMGYIVPTDAPNPNRDHEGFLTKAMDMQMVEVYAKRIQSKHALFLFDSCFSGSIFALSRAIPENISYKTSKPVRQFITSGSADEQVPDVSIFRRQFIAALEGEGDVDNDGYVTGGELGEFLQKKVVNYSKGSQHPQYGKIRNPNLDKGDFVFVAGGSIIIEEEAKEGTLIIKSKPSSAKLYINGNHQGKTPLKLSLSPGRYEIMVEEKGYITEKKSVRLRKGKTLNLTLYMDKEVATGNVRVESEPKSAEIYIDGDYIGKTPDTIPDLKPGRYSIEVRKKGYKSWSKTFAVEAGKEVELTARLEEMQTTQKEYTDPVTGMEFVFVQGGCFQMGCGSWTSYCDSDEKPVHEVCVANFYIGKFEVTQKEFKKVMEKNLSDFKGDRRPVRGVTWYEADEFCRKIGGRRPTETEWEYAARSGGKKEKYSGSNNVDSVAWYTNNSGRKPQDVGTKSPNGLGIYDMSGNVWEWVSDWYGENYYKNSPRDNPKGPSDGTSRVLRGGSWGSSARHVRTSTRGGGDPGLRDDSRGFRCAGTF